MVLPNELPDRCLESKKLDQIFKTIAYFGGPQQVRDHNRYSITQRIWQEYFKDKEIPRLASERVHAFLDEFKEYLPPEDLEETIQKMKKWLEILMKIKCDLLVADLRRKWVFIPPGTAFDSDSMHAQDGEGSDITIGRSIASQYCLKLCTWSALTEVEDHSLFN